MDNLDIIVNSAFGVEAVTKRELKELGISDAPAMEGRICFKGGYDTVAELNMFLRTADRVLIKLSEFAATTFDELFDGIINTDFEKFLSADARILVDAKSVRSGLFALSAIQKIAKKAIVERLKKAYRINEITEEGADYKIEISIFKDIVTVALDTSGDGLHKRGYRDKVWIAPLKETLAAAMIKLSVWNYGRALLDPFCGSGTIPIEAAMIALEMAPGMNRNFAFEAWKNFPKESISRMREKAADVMKRDRMISITGYDIDKKAIELSKYHAEKAGVKINFVNKDMRDFKSDASHGVIVTNPPYGERLLNDKELKDLYGDFYKMYQSLDNWSMYVLTASDNFERYLGAKAIRNRKLYNAKIECRLYTYLGDKPQY